MPLAENIKDDLDRAVKDRDEITASILRLFRATLKNKEIEKRGPLAEEEVQVLIAGQIKRHRESIEEFKKGNRPDLVLREEAQMKVLAKYLPEQLSEPELREVIDKIVAERGATSVKQLGLVMGEVMKMVKGKAEGGKVKALVEEALNKTEK